MGPTVPLLAALLLSPAADVESEKLPAAVQKVLDAYLKAVAAKDVNAMAALADIPWLDRDRKVIRDRPGLPKALERVEKRLAADNGDRKVEAISYKKVRDRIEKEAERKLFDDVLGDNGWIISVEEDGQPLSMRNILIRVKNDKPAVVAGPLKPNQLMPQNRIPEVVEQLLDKAETFELYSLDPDREPDAKAPVKDGFQGWKVLGKTEVKAAADRTRLASALRLGAEDNFGIAAACFIPRHGIRLAGGGKTVDLVICFQCLSVQLFVDGERKDGFLTTSAPQPAFDAVLKAAGVKLAKPAKE